jgi:sugar transferase (PEP-CTERM/EpsH1 system associated)
MSERLAVLHLITELNFGGAEQLLVDSLRYSQSGRFRYEVVTLFDGDTSLAAALRQAGIPVTDLRLKSAGRIGRLWRFYRRLRRERPAILQGWLIHAILLGRVLGRLAGVPVIIAARHSVNLGGRFRDSLNRLTAPLSNCTIAICDLMRRVEIAQGGAPPDKIVTIYNGIPPLEFPPRDVARMTLRRRLDLPDDAVVVGTVARLHAIKGHAVLAHAIPRIVAQRPQAHFVWVGDGQERDNLARLVAELGVAAHVYFAGSQGDVPHWLAGMDLFMLPSLGEGVSVALLEAMAAELPVVATAVGGTPEVVVEGETGLLVPPRDPAALAEAIITLLRDPARMADMGRNGRQRVANQFSLEKMIQQTETLYEALIQEKSRLHYVGGQGWQPL